MDQALTMSSPWSISQKLTLRYCFLFFVQYIFFNPNGVLPYVDVLYEKYIDPFHRIIPWVGKHILHIPYDITVFTNGSGDTTYDYVIIFFIAMVSLIGCIIWSVIDRNRKSYNRLYYWLTVIVRYYVAFTMLSYGSFKVFKLQFSFPGPARLLEPYGQSSPMGLAWTFMGYSKGYNYFTGFAEVLGGVLLLFRKTTMLGAIVSFIVMANVMAMNYCFDIPVKLLSTTLVVMCLFLMAKDIMRLYNFFIANKPVQPRIISAPPYKKKWVRVTLTVAKVLLVGYSLVMTTYGAVNLMKEYGDAVPKGPLWGVYNVETWVRNNDTVPPLQTDTVRWKQLVIGARRKQSSIIVKGMNDSLTTYACVEDTLARAITMFRYDDTTKKYRFTYTEPDSLHFVMHGNWKGDSLVVQMRKYKVSDFLLVKRGFRWINEFPFNR